MDQAELVIIDDSSVESANRSERRKIRECNTENFKSKLTAVKPFSHC
jgi:hypothetical protein